MTAPGPRPRTRRQGGHGSQRGGNIAAASNADTSDDDQRRPSFLVYKPEMWQELLERTREELDKGKMLTLVECPSKRHEVSDLTVPDLKLHLGRLSSKISEAVGKNDATQLESVLEESSSLGRYFGMELTEHLNCALMEAVTNQCGRAVSLLLSAGADATSFRQSLLITAVDFNAPSVVYALIDHGFDVNLKGSHGTALHSAMRVGNLDLADALYLAGADLNAVDDTFATPLHLAVQMKNYTCVEWLVEHSCEVNNVDTTWGRTPLHWAAMFTNTEILQFLIENGADPLAMDKNGCAPWTLAVTNKNLDSLRILFSEYSVNMSDAKGKSPLHWASRSGFTSGLEYLIKKGSSVNAKDSEGITPLMDALAMRQVQSATMLIDNEDLDVRLCDFKGKTSLHWSCRTGIVSCAKLLLEKGAVCNASDATSVTPFQEAVAIRHAEVVETLIKHTDFDINLRDWKGRTPLHWVARTGLVTSVDLLLNLGADVNVGNQDGRTPLMDAVLSGELDVIGILMDWPDTRIDQLDNYGQSALHLLLADGPNVSMSILERLALGGADLNLPLPNTGRSPLIEYIKYRPQVAQALLSVGADPNVITGQGETALLRAVESGCMETVRLVLNANADLSVISGVVGPHGVTPVIEACGDEDTDLYKLLVNAGCSLAGVAYFLDEVACHRVNPDIDRELSWLEARLSRPISLLEAARASANRAIGHRNYQKKLKALDLPRRLTDLLTLDGFLRWKQRHDLTFSQ